MVWRKVLSVSVIFYIFMFFMITPTHLAGLKFQSSLISQTTYYTSYGLYWSWIQTLDDDNIIKESWVGNGAYWCNKFERCTVE